MDPNATPPSRIVCKFCFADKMKIQKDLHWWISRQFAKLGVAKCGSRWETWKEKVNDHWNNYQRYLGLKSSSEYFFLSRAKTEGRIGDPDLMILANMYRMFFCSSSTMTERFVKGLVSWIVQVLINMAIDYINEFVKVAYLSILWP